MNLRLSPLSVLTISLCLYLPTLAQENLASDAKPDALVLERAVPLPPTVMRWIVPATSRSADGVGHTAWTSDGHRMFAQVMSGYVQCWKPAGAGDTLELEGRLKLEERWVLSPDGKWLFAHPKSWGNKATWAMYRADTLAGVWCLRPNALGYIGRGAISQDGRLTAVVHKDGTSLAISILDTATGTRLRVLRPPANAPAWQSAADICFAKDALLLAPGYDQDNRVMRWPISTWNPEFVTEAQEATGMAMTLSKDERWLVCWDEGGYQAFERNGLRYTRRFQGEAETRPGFVSGLQSVRLSPDGTQLVISGNGQHKVIRLANQTVLHEAATHCMCGEFAPDGRKFWKTCEAFRAVSTASWEELPEAAPGHHAEVHSVAFSPGGQKFASADTNSILVWPLTNLTHPQELIPQKAGHCLTCLAWQSDSLEVWAGDSLSYLHWPVPPNTTGKPLTGKDGFPAAPKRDDAMRTQLIAPVVSPNSWMVSNDEGSFGGVEIRNPEKPGVVRKLANFSNLDFIASLLVISQDRKEAYYMYQSKVRAVDLTNDTARNGTDRIVGDIVGLGGNPARLLVMARNKLTLVDAATLKPLEEILAPGGVEFFGPGGGSKSAVSPDGRWLFCNISKGSDSDVILPALVDLAQRKIVATVPRLDANIHVWDFSPDSRLIVAGHGGGSVSLWNVANLAANGTMVDIAAPPATANTTTRGKSAGGSTPARGSSLLLWQTDTLQPETFAFDKGDTWTITTAGSVTNAASGFDVGRLFVNEEAPKARAMRTRRPANSPSSLIAELVSESLDGRVHIRREFRTLGNGDMRWIDTVENLSPEPLTLTLAFESALGGGAVGLRGRDNRAPTLQIGGALDVTPPNTGLGMKTNTQNVQRFASVCYSSSKPDFFPAVKWNEATRSVRTEWALRLEPFELRTILHEAGERRLDENSPAEPGIRQFNWMGLADAGIEYRLPSLLNYRPEEMDQHWVQESQARSKQDSQGYFKDSLGFRWRRGIAGMGGELGADRILELWMDGAPVTFHEVATVPAPDGGRISTVGTNYIPIAGPVRVNRESIWFGGDGTVAMKDIVSNPSSEPAKCRMELAVIATKQFVQVLAGDGRVLDFSRPVPVASCGGTIAIVAEGADKPATLVGLGDRNQSTPPATVRWVAGRGVFLTYDMDLTPGQEISLMHLATQRPIGAYETVKEGIAQLNAAKVLSLPSKRRPPVNWMANPTPGPDGNRVK